MRVIASDLDYIMHNIGDLPSSLKDKTILITGGTGFIGKWLLESLCHINNRFNLNLKLLILTRNSEKFLNQFPYYRSEGFMTWINGDIRTFEYPQMNIDYIIHAATEANARLNIENPLLMSDVIIHGTRHLLEFAVTTNANRVLFLSSGAVYGNQPDGINGFREDFMGAPNQLERDVAYAESKRIAEFLCATYARKHNINIPIARGFAFIGPYLPLNAHFAVGNFINDGLNRRDITITGNGSQLRSYMYAADMVIWLLTILLKGKKGEAYNVGSDKPISIKDLATEVAKFFPNIKINVLNKVNLTDRNQNYVPETSKSQNLLFLNNMIEIEEAIGKTISFYREYH